MRVEQKMLVRTYVISDQGTTAEVNMERRKKAKHEFGAVVACERSSSRHHQQQAKSVCPSVCHGQVNPGSDPEQEQEGVKNGAEKEEEQDEGKKVSKVRE